jgi:hypothetical protein
MDKRIRCITYTHWTLICAKALKLTVRVLLREEPRQVTVKDGPPGSLVARATSPLPGQFMEGGNRRTDTRRESRGREAQARVAETQPMRAGYVCDGGGLHAAFVASQFLAKGVLGQGCS